MPLTVDQLREEVLALPHEDRQNLIASVSDADEQIMPLRLHPAWPEELRYRSAEFKAGRMGSVTLEDYLKELDEPLHP